MTLRRLLIVTGLTGMVALLGFTFIRTLRHSTRETLGGKTLVRFAHTQLEPGVREAFDAVARDYMATHPDVRVEQITVPRRTWAQWLETRLIGGDSPDLLQLVNNDPNLLLRHFQPLDEWMDAPNPHNAGTPLARTLWRDTFIAPLTEPPTYWPRFLHYYGAPLTIFSARMFCNHTLLREITGGDQVPRTYAQFTALCRQIQTWAREHNREIFPVAGARPVPPNDGFFTLLLRSQSQRLMVERVDRTSSLGGGGGAGGDLLVMAREGYFHRRWSLRDPEIAAGFSLVRAIGEFYQPGFLGADRDEAIFYFLQGRAVMIASGSWDYSSITAQVGFEVVAFPAPAPTPGDPEFGEFAFGPPSEAQNPMRGAFALSKQSLHPKAAVDFLQFLTSVRAHRTFTAISRWVPVVRGVEIDAAARSLAPQLSGYPLGLNFNVGVESTRLWENYINLLYGPGDGVQRLISKLDPLMDRAVIADEAKESRDSLNVIADYDARAIADEALRRADGTGLLSPARRSELFEAQADLEMLTTRLRYLQQNFKPR